jgi:hypothetical protein
MPDLSSQIRDPRLRRFYDYCEARKGADRFLARRAIDPLDFPYLLGNIMLVDVLREPLRFRVRLHGANLAARATYDLTGKLMDEVPITDYRRYVIARCEGLVETGEPILVHHNRIIDGRSRQYEALWLPLSDTGVDVTMLLCALIYAAP